MEIVNDFNWVSSSVLVDTWTDWPSVSIFSWIHGNEASWITANKRFLSEVQDWVIDIIKWRILFVLESNQEAIKIWQREVAKNMNRLFTEVDQDWNDYEAIRANELRNLLKIFWVDKHLDLHSTSEPSIPFMFAEKDKFDEAKKLGVSHIIWWWWELSNWVMAWDTENYVNMLWWSWFTFEAGNHDSPDWEKNAYQMILNFLVSNWLIDKKYFKEIWNDKNFLMIQKAYIANSDNFKYAIEIENFKNLEKWTLIWYDDEVPVLAEEDMVLIMPKKQEILKKWIEVFLIWKKS